MSSSMPRKSAEREYLLVASGKLQVARYLADWKTFKDHIRKYVKEQPGWTTVFPGRNHEEKQGWCKLKDLHDAEAVFNASKSVCVHIFTTSLVTGYWSLEKCNCNRHFRVGDKGHSTLDSGIDAVKVNEVLVTKGAVSAAPNPVPAPPVPPVQPTYQYANYYQPQSYNPNMYPYPAPPPQPFYSQVYAGPPVYPQLYTAPPVYSQNAVGLPVNLSSGGKVTEERGIFIQGLDYSVNDAQLRILLSEQSVRSDKVRVHRKSDGSSKGVATAEFRTKGEAEYAVVRLNGLSHKGRVLMARLDKETKVVASYEPLIVDGSNRSGR